MDDNLDINKPIGIVIKSKPNFGGVAPKPAVPSPSPSTSVSPSTSRPRRLRVGENASYYRHALNQGNWLIDLENSYGMPINEWTTYNLSKWISKYYEFKKSISSLSTDYNKGIVDDNCYQSLCHISEELDILFRKSNTDANHAPSADAAEVGKASNHGKAWDTDDLKALREDFSIRKVSISTIAEKLGRTECSVYCKLETMKLISADENPYHGRLDKKTPKAEKQSSSSKTTSFATIKETSPVLNKYVEYFSHLNRSVRNGENAPHKLVLLLAVLQRFDLGVYRSTIIPLDEALINAFESLWNKYVKTSTFNPDVAMPFYHMDSEPFWSLVPKSQDKIIFSSTPSVRMFNHCFKGAQIDWDLYNLCKDSSSNDVLRYTLISQLKPSTVETSVESSIQENFHKSDTVPVLSNKRETHLRDNTAIRKHENVFFEYILEDFSDISETIADILKRNFQLRKADMVVEIQGHDEDPNFGYFEYGFVNFASSCMPFITRRLGSTSGGTRYRLFTFERTKYLDIKKKPFDFDEAIENLIMSGIF